jgi:hypothetical protein
MMYRQHHLGRQSCCSPPPGPACVATGYPHPCTHARHAHRFALHPCSPQGQPPAALHRHAARMQALPWRQTCWAERWCTCWATTSEARGPWRSSSLASRADPRCRTRKPSGAASLLCRQPQQCARGGCAAGHPLLRLVTGPWWCRAPGPRMLAVHTAARNQPMLRWQWG